MGSRGIHIDANSASSDLLIEQNSMSGMENYGYELQGEVDGVGVYDNDFSSPVDGLGDSVAYSLILDKSENIIVRRNRMLGDDFVKTAFETGGGDDTVPTLMEDNFAIGGWHFAGNTDNDGPTQVVVKNNRYVNFGKGPTDDNGSGDVTLENNGPDVELTWDIERAAPQRWVRYEWLYEQITP